MRGCYIVDTLLSRIPSGVFGSERSYLKKIDRAFRPFLMVLPYYYLGLRFAPIQSGIDRPFGAFVTLTYYLLPFPLLLLMDHHFLFKNLAL